MPDDERLGGTRDPHEQGSRHRRGETPPPPEEQPRRRRRSVESGGVSVADLVQRHTGSRPDLTPVNPEQLRQNAVLPGRRARQDEPPPPPPQPGPPGMPQNRQTAANPIAAALDGTPPAPQRGPANGSPRDPGPQGPRDPGPAGRREETPRKPGGTSSFFTIPSDALRSSVSSEAPDAPVFPAENGFPADFPDFPEEDGPAHRPRGIGEGSGPRNGFPRDPRPGGLRDVGPGGPRDAGPGGFGPDAPGRNGFPPDAGAPRRGRRGDEAPGFGQNELPGFPQSGTYPSNGAPGFAQNEPPGFPQDGPEPGGPRRKGARRVRGTPSPIPRDGLAQEGFPQDAFDADPNHGGRRPGEGSGPRNGFPPDASRRNGARRVGEALPADGFPQDGFGPDADAGRRGGPRRVGEASAHYPLPGTDPRRVGEASAHHPIPGNDGFPPEASRRNDARRVGEAPAPGPNAFAPDPEASRRNGARRPGEALPADGFPQDEPGGRNGFPPDTKRRKGGPRGRGDGFPQDGFPPDAEASRRGARRGGEAGPFPGPGFPPDGDAPRPGPRQPGDRRIGDASTHFGVPGEDPRQPGDRRVGEASAHFGMPGEPGDRRVGEASAHFGIPGDDPRQPGDRRVGEASAHFGVPGEPGDRRVGEASAHFGIPGEDPRGGHRGPGRPGEAGFPGEGFPPESGPGRPEGAARRRAARAAVQPELSPRPFPADTPPQPGQGSGLFPVDEFRRQGDELSEPRPPAAVDAPEPKPRRSTGVPPVPPPPPPMGDDDLVTMTTEMEAIGDEVQQRRRIDHTLARFSAVHDEILAEEREKKAKRRKLRPWERDDEMDRLDELDAQQSMAMAIPNFEPRDEEEDEDPAKAKKKRRWRKGRTAGKAFTVFFAGLIFLSTAVAWGFKSYIENSSQQVDALDPDSAAIKDAAAQLGDENFLLVGSDTRAGATAEDGVGDEKTVEGARSDTVMIAHVPKNRERVVVVSFPRDLEVSRPACEGFDPKTGNYTGEQHPAAKRVKINTAYQVGGPMCVTKVVQELSGLAINHFVGIDFHGFKDMVDAVQGVEVCVERPMKDDVLGMVVPEAGTNVKLTGDQALNFVRARHVEGDVTSDYGRITRQQRFLSSLLRKAMSGEVLLNPGKLTKFVDAFSKATFGDNIGIEQLFTLGQSMQGVEAGRVTFITIPTVGDANSRGNEDLRVEDSNALFEAIRQDVPLPGEAPKTADDASQKNKTQVQSGLKQDQPAPTPVDPRTIKLQVLNGGNNREGIAGDTADDLAEYGFQIVRVDSTDPVDTTVIKYSKTREAQAQTLKAAVPGATLVEDPSMAGAIMLIIGPGFDGKVVSPTGGGPLPEVPENLSTVNAGDISCA